MPEQTSGHPTDPAELRRLAELSGAADWTSTSESEVPVAVRRTLHDLRVHQIELEMQNEALRQAQAELETWQARYLDLYDHAPVGFLTFDDAGVVIEANVTVATLLGVARDELIGAQLSRFVAREDQDVLYLRRRQLFAEGQTKDFELRLATGVAEPVWVRVQAILSSDADDRPAVRASLLDHTERKAAEDELARLNEQLEARVSERTAALEAANRELETFSYSVSHDLKSPLRAITGFAEILERRYGPQLDAKGRHYLDNIVEGGRHMGALIEELLEYSRPDPGPVGSVPVPLGPILERLRTTYAERIRVRGGMLAVAEPLAVPLADPGRLEQVLANLLDNALTYRRDGVVPRVTVSAVRAGDRVTVEVADNGLGIAPEHQEQIFEPFVRLHSSEAYPGTGIGLATVRKAARRMGSEVTLVSVPGEGSTFALDLPAAAVAEARR